MGSPMAPSPMNPMFCFVTGHLPAQSEFSLKSHTINIDVQRAQSDPSVRASPLPTRANKSILASSLDHKDAWPRRPRVR
jgi:hypothetical protein